VDDEGRKMMRKMFFFFMRVLMILAASAAVPGISSGQVLINEYMPDPARDWDGDGVYDYRSDEWVEIINSGDSAVDLDGLLLRDAGDAAVWRYKFSGELAPGETRIVYGSDALAWEESTGFPQYGLSLNNAGDEILLFRTAAGETLMVDSASYGRSALDDRSIGRTLADPSAWAVFDAWNPCSDSCSPAGNGCIPTPGAINSCTTPVAETSWGSIKQLSR
jgi:hypothetical protein